MKSIRRLYIYAVSLVSMEVVVWALIGLARSALEGSSVGRQTAQLAGALALILVGTPVFGLHWWLAQRDAVKDDEERFSNGRAVFFYAAFAGLLVPVVQNILALINRGLASALSLDSSYVLVGGYQTIADNLTAVLFNGLIAYYFYTVIGKDWAAQPKGDWFPNVRRAARYLWMLYGLGYAISGIYSLLVYTLDQFEIIGSGGSRLLANGVSFILVGLPLWFYVWNQIQISLNQPAESSSQMRLLVIYLLNFLAVVVVLVSGGTLVSILIRAGFGDETIRNNLLSEMSNTLAAAVTAGIVWGYYGRVLDREGESLGDVLRRTAMRRLYYYVLAFMGLAASYGGLQSLLLFLVEVSMGDKVIWGTSLQNWLANSLAALLVGLPLWLRTWLPMSAEAAVDNELGDHARRSINRKGYLYLTLFVGVMGVMFSAGAMFFQLISALLGQIDLDFTKLLVDTITFLVLFSLLTLYQWRALRVDSRLASRLLTAQHSEFSAAVFEPDEGEFAEEMIAALKAEAPDLPVAVHPLSETFDESLKNAGAVILPASLAANPPEAVRLWLADFEGMRVVVPLESSEWVWVGVDGSDLHKLSQQAADVVRQLAEGQSVSGTAVGSAWVVVGYIAAGFFGLFFLCMVAQMVGRF